MPTFRSPQRLYRETEEDGPAVLMLHLRQKSGINLRT
jgi:hypothetical protein